ncbi:Hypothetical predicted protein [Mytilus galloprovincialis]|uniref:DDE Tnp4 domain-containing protein n=1 Tax=Mytilus galloprovincialis TaxID=29158 RepID=A0A8B6H0X5_MYTGA|nr:Hypothetical predicted protein [Mytilus galloprovincialis]
MFEFDLQRPTRRSRAFPVSLQVMIALRFFATGSFQLVYTDVHNINVQGVCNSNLKVLNNVAKWPGATHDAFIWAYSRLSEMFEDGSIDHGWLIGDSGYHLRPWLLTPVLNLTTRNQKQYNASHMKTRSVDERSFRVIKSRFRK